MGQNQNWCQIGVFRSLITLPNQAFRLKVE
jgi:hypothetical protein